MAASVLRQHISHEPAESANRPTIVFGITHSQTCIILAGRLQTFRAAGYRVIVVSSPGDHLQRVSEEAGVEAIAVPISRHISPLSDLVSFIRLYRLLGRLKPDIVEFSTPKAGMLGTAAAMLQGVRCRIYMLRGLRLETVRGFKRWVLLSAERIASACAHVVLCNSDSLRNLALALGIAPAQKLCLLGDGSSNGVDVDRFSPGPTWVRAELGIPDKVPVIGFVGRFTRDKGLEDLFISFIFLSKSEPALHLLLVGWFDASEDALSSGLRDRILSHPRIHCTGFVADTAPYYRAMDMMVLPTWREGFPNAILEAAASGIPVISTECTGSRDAVVPEVTGLLIPPGYPEAIFESVLKLLRDSRRRKRMGRAARAWVQEHYNEQRVLTHTAAYYRSLLNDVPRHLSMGEVGDEINSVFLSS
jgi:glycosyltransferase involved in cell wall biosynthesis